jgi:acyl-CoA synthetase (AMP-forming)/AMP-acid ligase II
LLLHDHVDYWARVQPDAEFAIQGGRVLSYARAAEQVRRIAAGLRAAGCGPGDRVAVLARNCIEYPLFCFAASRIGAVPVTLNFRLAPPEWRYILEDARPRVLLAQGELAAAIDPVTADLPGLAQRVALADGCAGWSEWDEWLAREPHPAEHRARPADDALQLYTSGTTGRPKGAVLSQQAVFAVIYHWSLLYPVRARERQLVISPMYHASGLYGFCHGAAVGAALYIMSEFDPAEVARALDEERLVRASLVPAMIQSLLGVPGVGRREFRELRAITYGGSPIAEATLRRALEVFDCELIQSYGMTELSCATYLGGADHRRALDGHPELLLSVGLPAPGCAVRIADGDRALPPGEIGEICSRGPQVMSGYWNLPEATSEALRDGWMHTGDAGYLDAEGYLYIMDRTKDMIVSGGENVYPREVENALFEHPAVADVAVIGVPSERWGETVKAIVVLARGCRASPQELMDFCRGRIAGYKRPTSVDFVDQLPRNASGKVLKRELREPYWQGYARRVS